MSKKSITLEYIEKKYKVQTYGELYQKVLFLIKNEEIIPKKVSGKNGKKPSLYNEYWLMEKQVDNSEYIEELSYMYVPEISIDYYLKNIKQYKEDRKYILLLNKYLKEKSGELLVSKSMNERSFDIWYREKFLKEEQGKKILKRCGINIEKLNLYETMEPLSYYTHTRNIPQNMLILENKDTFYSMRKRLLEGNNLIFGVEIGTLIYGGGKKIHRSFNDFLVCVEPYMREESNTILYFGDLDYEGIIIYEKLAEAFSGNCIISPFKQAYLRMVEKAEVIGMDNLPDTKEGQNRNIGTLFIESFLKENSDKIRRILENNKYIPQEILSLEDF